MPTMVDTAMRSIPVREKSRQRDSNRISATLSHVIFGVALTGAIAIQSAIAAARAAPAPAAVSTLRMACDDNALNAEVSVNGTFRGECPIDVQVKAGEVIVHARKVISGKEEKFDQKVRFIRSSHMGTSNHQVWQREAEKRAVVGAS